MPPPLLQHHRLPTKSLENVVGVSTQKPKRVKKVRRKKWRKKTHRMYEETMPPLTLATNNNDNLAFNGANANSQNANNHIPNMSKVNPYRYSDTNEEIQIKPVQGADNDDEDGIVMDRDELIVKDLR